MPKSTVYRPHDLSPAALWQLLSRRLRSNLRRLSETRSATRRIRAYWLMSDAELRARSLKREDIVRLVLAGVI
ncbi:MULTISPECIES: hypothetical protein [unclassified Ruegeria]|uniref:hypothetical protein n=1 Tax=unclassified Ruegeria TaxID=2625375 RepID=UPI0014898C5A|nr:MULTISPECIES: hypothetical protein [unclassified Ruegeria]